jgi:hypothetical protein
LVAAVSALLLFQLFNEFVLRRTAVIFDLLSRGPRALYGGFKAAIAAMGAPDIVASAIGLIIASGVILGLIWMLAKLPNSIRVNNPSVMVVRIGTTIFLFCCLVGVYFFIMTLYLLILGAPSEALLLLFGTAIFFPVVGRSIRYLLGR